MRTRLVGYGALVLWIALASCVPPGQTPKRYALVYGISVYDGTWDEGYGINLTWSDDDARSLAQLLEDQGYDVRLRINTEATRAQLLADLADLGGIVGPDDLLLVYYSGHGGVLSDFSSLLDPDVLSGQDPASRWIFPYGSVSGTGVDLGLAISDDEMPELLSVVGLDRTVLILDSCNSGGFVGSGSPDVDIVPSDISNLGDVDREKVLSRAVLAYRDYGGHASGGPYVLSAAGSDDLSWETPSIEHGVFTYYLLEAATRGDLNEDGVVTVLEAYAYTVGGISATWNWGVDSDTTHGYFHPHLTGGAVDFALFDVPP